MDLEKLHIGKLRLPDLYVEAEGPNCEAPPKASTPPSPLHASMMAKVLTLYCIGLRSTRKPRQQVCDTFNRSVRTFALWL